MGVSKGFASKNDPQSSHSHARFLFKSCLCSSTRSRANRTENGFQRKSKTHTFFSMNLSSNEEDSSYGSKVICCYGGFAPFSMPAQLFKRSGPQDFFESLVLVWWYTRSYFDGTFDTNAISQLAFSIQAHTENIVHFQRGRVLEA